MSRKTRVHKKPRPHLAAGGCGDAGKGVRSATRDRKPVAREPARVWLLLIKSRGCDESVREDVCENRVGRTTR